VLRRRDEAEGSEAASVVGLTVRFVFENARVLTAEPRRPVAAALAVDGTRIVAVGDRRAVTRAAGRGAVAIDCDGGTVLPGLIDPHLHLFGLAARDAHLDCSAFGDVDALVAAIATRTTASEPGAWIRGEGLDEVRLGRLPSLAELDRAAPANPVRLRHRSRHASLLSSRALARMPRDVAGVDRSTGLVSGREPLVGKIVGPLPRGELERGLVRASRELAAFGVTTVADATPRRASAVAPLRRLIDAGDFAQRVFAMRPWNVPAWRGRGRLRPGPVKIMVEETPHGLDPEPRALARRIRHAAAAGAQVAVHCVGVATLVAALDAFAALPRAHRRGRRHRLEHLAECPPPLVARVAALELTVVSNPAFVYWRGDVYRRETDGDARAWLYRARTLIDAGIPVAAASDAPVVPANPWITMAAARTRRTRDGETLGARERVDPARALAMVTADAARALHADRLGTIAPGAPADLVVVGLDPLRASPAALRDAPVALTMIDGRVVWRA
jgi:predicted amidohydrolase YtcJ